MSSNLPQAADVTGLFVQNRQDLIDSINAMDRAQCERSLAGFVKRAWRILEPNTPYLHNWHIDAMCQHLEAITDGRLSRLLINVPPGALKSLLVSVFWPAWEWGPRAMPETRYITASHAQNLAIRDSTKMRRLIQSEWYQRLWGSKSFDPKKRYVTLTNDQNTKLKFENYALGFREACAAGSMTGSRGDRIIIDDPHSVQSAASDAERNTTLEWFLEAVPTRVNDFERSAIVVIMQRLHSDDVSGAIISKELGYEHLMLPMEFEPERKCYTSLGWEDPRTEAGELLFPARFSRETVDKLKKQLGSYGAAGQLQQRPAPRGGGVIKRDWWRCWDDETARENGLLNSTKYPKMRFILMSMDTAYTEKTENDPSACTVWGVWEDKNQHTRLMLMYAWQERLEFPDLLKKIKTTAERYKVDRLLVESKASGQSIAQELRRTSNTADYGVTLMDPKGASKLARANSVTHMWENGLIYAPDETEYRWADEVITQAEEFPRAKHDDLVDSCVYAVTYLRDSGILQLPDETDLLEQAEMQYDSHRQPNALTNYYS